MNNNSHFLLLVCRNNLRLYSGISGSKLKFVLKYFGYFYLRTSIYFEEKIVFCWHTLDINLLKFQFGFNELQQLLNGQLGPYHDFSLELNENEWYTHKWFFHCLELNMLSMALNIIFKKNIWNVQRQNVDLLLCVLSSKPSLSHIGKYQR